MEVVLGYNQPLLAKGRKRARVAPESIGANMESPSAFARRDFNARRAPRWEENTVMASAEFHHFGVPTTLHVAGADYLEGAKLYLTDPEKHPYRIEFLRFEEGCPMPEVVQKNAHAAFVVANLDEALKGQNIIIPPFEPRPTLRCAFIQDGDAVIELMQRL
jgi:hypothetical protein